jgi:hypothetical protein
MPSQMGGYNIYAPGENIPDMTSWGRNGGQSISSIPAPAPIQPPRNTGPGAGAAGAAAGAGIAAGALPGYSGDLSSIGGNISSETAGKLPADVIQQIQQQAAERGVATGSPGSDNSNAALLRAMGLTSLQLTQQGQQDFSSILGSLPGYNLSQNPGLYTTPGENLSANVSESQRQAGQQGLGVAQVGVRQGLGMGGGGGVTFPGAGGGGGLPQFDPFGAGYASPAGGGNPNALGITPLGGSLMTGNAMQPSEVDKILQSFGNYNPSQDESIPQDAYDPETGLLRSQGTAPDPNDPAYYDMSMAGAG